MKKKNKIKLTCILINTTIKVIVFQGMQEMNETFHMRGSLYNGSKMSQKFRIIILLRLKTRTFLRGKSPVICLNTVVIFYVVFYKSKLLASYAIIPKC